MAARPAATAAVRIPATVTAATKITEVYPAQQDPDLLDAIRKKNTAAIASILDPKDELPIKDSSNADDAVCPPMQVFARGSVNHKGFVLQDVWYVPECKVNLVSYQKLGKLGLLYSVSDGTVAVKDCDGVLVGKGRLINGLSELEFLNTLSGEVPWYISSNATEHMTGNMFLRTDFTSMRPDRPVRTHTGILLQVQGKGFLRSKHLAVPDVSYVPGLTENIISPNQLTDSGFDVIFEPGGCIVVRRNDEQQKVGTASHSGGQLY